MDMDGMEDSVLDDKVEVEDNLVKVGLVKLIWEHLEEDAEGMDTVMDVVMDVIVIE